MPGGTQPAQGWSGTAFDDGILYIGSMDGRVMAVNSSTRDLEWSYTIARPPAGGMSCRQTATSAIIYGTPAVDGDLVYVGTYSGKLYALNIATGVVRWNYPKEGYMGSIVCSPLVADGTVYVCSSNGKESDNKKRSRVYALDTIYGEYKWRSDPLGEKLWLTPAIEGDTIYVSTFDGYLYVLSTEDGSLLPWRFEAEVGFVSSPVIYEDTIFVGSFDRNLYAVKIGDNKPLWKFSGGNWFWAVPLVRNSIVYAGCLDGKVYAIDINSGNELWEFDAESPIVVSPILVNDSLVVASESGNVYIINSKTGESERIKNSEEPGNDNRASIDAPIQASLCAQGAMAYVHAQDNCLYALDIERGKITWKLPLTIKQE